MQFDKFDDKLKQAAEQHHPNYDEQAWTKMEKLLDRHLPQKDDRRRRIIFFLLFLLLTGTGVWLIIDKPWQQEKTVSAYQNSRQEKTADHSSTGSPKKTGEATGTSDLSKTTITEPQQQSTENPPTGKTLLADKEKANHLFTTNNKPVNNKSNSRKPSLDNSFEAVIEPGNVTRTNKPGKTDMTISSPAIQKEETNIPFTTTPSTTTNERTTPVSKEKDQGDIAVNDNIVGDKSKLPGKDITDEHLPVTVEKKPIRKNNSKHGNAFFVSVSAGPDISSVGAGKLGKVELVGGAGFGYTFNNRWTLRTGFYTARKVYSATKEAYKPDIVIPNYNYLDGINADCKVYEIPLSLAYNFAASAKGNWFTSAGLSSYIMKKEVYDYIYNYPGSPTYVYTKTVDNENKHYFSVLSLSAGYQRKISKTLSIAAEPYARIPLTGIGFGNVKLNSAGVLFTVSLNLFQPASGK